jgi:hypothetical protein
MRYFILFILSITLFAAEDPTKPNPIVEKALNPSLVQATKAYESYKNALDKISTQAVKDLEKAKSDAMKKGDLPTATALDNMVKDIKNGKLADMVADSIKPKEGTDLLGDDSKLTIVGTWEAAVPGWKNTIIVDKDMTFKTVDGYGGKVAFRKGEFTLAWNVNNITSTIILKDTKTGTIKQSDRPTVGTLTRIVDTK